MHWLILSYVMDHNSLDYIHIAHMHRKSCRNYIYNKNKKNKGLISNELCVYNNPTIRLLKICKCIKK